MSEQNNSEKLQSVVESVYLKLLTRVGMPILLALLGYLGSAELGKITSALDVIPQLVTDQRIMGLKIDQMQKDLQSTAATVYSRDESAKDWIIQGQKDQILDATLKDHDRRIQSLETRVFK